MGPQVLSFNGLAEEGGRIELVLTNVTLNLNYEIKTKTGGVSAFCNVFNH